MRTAVRHAGAFTLIEMLVVMSIIAVMLGMGMAMFMGAAQRDRLGSAARALEGGMRSARSRAIRERKPVRFRFNQERRCFYAIREADRPNVNGVYGDHATDPPELALTGSDLDFLEGNVIREPLFGGNGLCNTTANTTAPADDVQVVDPGDAAAPGQIVVTAGDNEVLETSPVTDDEVAATRAEGRFLTAPQYIDEAILVARVEEATGSWEILDWDVIFDANGRASFPPAFETQMRRIRIGALAGDEGVIEIVILPTTGEIVVRHL